ncbi:hypothetical protein LCGC14_0336120 [marine sediment metagenome]|uniref:4Fe4S-binding SPASM domain-containing protein n=1 Tax=marine sediment metagenome TaxID=412755 RepID=A0A0F9TXS6_9ZZZZ
MATEGAELMHLTQFICFELGRECNLGHLHAKCPNTHPDRYKHVDTSQAMSDETIVDTAVALIQEHGFRGLIGFHYYNEPTLEMERMWRVAARIRTKETSAKFVLWTNGTYAPPPYVDVVWSLSLFDEIHVTKYEQSKSLPGSPLAEKSGRFVHQWPFDDRLSTTGDEPGRPEFDAPCCRMFTEMIFDYYGNVHLCCYDWRGLGTTLNVHKHSLSRIIGRWQAIRENLSGGIMTHRTDGPVPIVCRSCTAPGRNTGITDFVKAPAEAARAYRQEVLNRGK